MHSWALSERAKPTRRGRSNTVSTLVARGQGERLSAQTSFAKGDVIWDNARIACTPGTDSARLVRNNGEGFYASFVDASSLWGNDRWQNGSMEKFSTKFKRCSNRLRLSMASRTMFRLDVPRDALYIPGLGSLEKVVRGRLDVGDIFG